MTTPWEKVIRGDKGEFCVTAHVDDDGYPVVTVIPSPEDGFGPIASDISPDGAEHELAPGVRTANRVDGQLQVTFCPVADTA